MSVIFFPLRSNAAWFSNSDSRLDLEARIKNCLVFYDRLIFEDGRYACFALDTGVFDHWSGPDAIENREALSYFSNGEGLRLLVGKTKDEMVPLLMVSGELRARYEVDFYPILKVPGLVDADGVSWRRIGRPVDENLFAAIQRDIRADQQDSGLRATLPVCEFLQYKIIESLHFDAGKAAFAVQCPFLVDERCRELVAAKIGRLRDRLARELRAVVVGEWVPMGLPDFSALTWDQVMRVRESAAGRDLRNMISRLAEQIGEAHAAMSVADLNHLAKQHITAELVDEATSRLTSPKDVALNLITNLIPFGAIASTGGDVQDLLSSSQSWVSLLKRVS